MGSHGQASSGTLRQLEIAVSNIWQDLSFRDVNNLIESMTIRVVALIETHGRAT